MQSFWEQLHQRDRQAGSHVAIANAVPQQYASGGQKVKA